MDKILFKDPVAIVTNNTCNLTCNHCGHLNNYNFMGRSPWKQFKPLYEKWSELVDFVEIDLLGGEPFLIPDLEEWVCNLRRLWPTSKISIGTNGTLLHLDKNKLLSKKIIDQNCVIKVCCHTKDQYKEIEKNLLSILSSYGADIQEDSSYSEKNELLRRFFINGKPVAELHEVYYFYHSFPKQVINGTVYLDNGDREISHDKCWSKFCFAIQDGLLFKCPLNYTYAQNKDTWNYEPWAREILDQYQPCSPFDNIDSIEKFLIEIKNSVPQCSLCAYDKKTQPIDISIPIVFDKSNKKMFKSIK